MDKYSQSLHTKNAISPELRNEIEKELYSLFSLQDYDIFDDTLRTSHFNKLSITMHQVIDEVDCNIDNIINTQVQKFSQDDIKHAVNVCLMSMITGIYLRFSRPVLHNLAFGALMHDLGNILINRNKSQRKDAYLHTLYGRHLLLKSSVDPSAAIIAAQHHEHYDGSGHPLGLSGKELHPLAKIVSIADYYDNVLTTALAKGISLNEMIENMLAESNKRFDPNILNAFFNTIAVYPVGSLVRLSNNQDAYIISNRARFPLRPVIRIFEDGKSSDIDLVFKPDIIIVEVIN